MTKKHKTREASTYRAARRNEAKARKLLWRHIQPNRFGVKVLPSAEWQAAQQEQADAAKT